MTTLAHKKAPVETSPPASPPETAGAPYRHELPRWLHKAGADSLRVDTPDQCDDALKDGWTLTPTP